MDLDKCRFIAVELKLLTCHSSPNILTAFINLFQTIVTRSRLSETHNRHSRKFRIQAIKHTLLPFSLRQA